MIRDIDERQITSEKLMSSSDMAKLGCNDCRGCSDCCKNRGSVILLDAFDMKMLKEGLSLSFAALMEKGYITLSVADGVVLPSMALKPGTDECVFLNAEGRCSIHNVRPGICRMYPLARIYKEDGTFSYFLQEGECDRLNGVKIKISKWLGYPNIKAYEKAVYEYHKAIKELREKCEAENISIEEKTVLQREFLKAQFVDI